MIPTPLGPLLAVASGDRLVLLQFADTLPSFERVLENNDTPLSAPLRSISDEIIRYFKRELTEFKTPIHLSGSPFQCSVWKTLMEIPFGETRSYKDQAHSIGKPTAYRAVAGANSANSFVILLPCHRIINSNGSLGGYAGGLERKKWLLHHEGVKGWL